MHEWAAGHAGHFPSYITTMPARLLPIRLRPPAPGWLLALILLIAVGIYLPGLHGDFFFDDFPNLILNRQIQITALTPEALLESMAASPASPFGRPLSQLSFAINHALAGFSPYSFKAVNLGLHLANGALVYALIGLLASLTLADRAARLLALWVAAVWLLHPINLTPVLHVVQRMTLLAGFFTLAALVLYTWTRLHCRRPGAAALFYALALLAWFAAFFSKESGLLWPLYVVALELILFSRSAPSARRVAWAMLAAFCLGLGLALWHIGLSWLDQGYQIRDFDMRERLLTESRALWFYARLLIFPALPEFSLYHDDFAISRNLLSPPVTLAAMLGWGLIAAYALASARRAPLFSLGLIWFLIGHSLESTILPLELVQEHRNYLAGIGLILAVSDRARALSERAAGWLGPTALTACAVAALGLLAILTGLRAHQYGHEIRRTQIEIAYHPLSARAHEEAGRVLNDYGRRHGLDTFMLAQASEYQEEAARLNPVAKLPYVNLIDIACTLSNPPKPSWIAELTHRVRERPFQTGDNLVIVSLADLTARHKSCLAMKDVSAIYTAMLANPTLTPPNRALVKFSWAIRLAADPDRIGQVERLLAEAVAERPASAAFRLRHAQLLWQMSDFAAAQDELSAAKSLRDLTVQEWQKLGGIELEQALKQGSDKR